jgi:DNA polymerase-3 subunit alpha
MDFCQRVDLRQVNKRVLESLIKSGAFDELGKRSDLLSIYERVAENAQISAKEKSHGQIGLFSAESTVMHQDNLNITEKLRYSKNELLKMEKDLIGLYLSGHPLDAIKDEFKNLPYNCLSIKPEDDGKIIVLKGILSDCRRIINKNQKEMISATLEDLSGEIRVLLFQNNKFEDHAKHFVDDGIVRIKGKVRPSLDEVTLICDDISSINISDSKECNLDLDIYFDEEIYSKVKNVCEKYPGNMPIFIHCGEATIAVNKKYWIQNEEECLRDLKTIIGAGNVWVV